MRNLLLLAILTVFAAPGAERATLRGKVTDNQGNPLADATVVVYHAGVSGRRRAAAR